MHSINLCSCLFTGAYSHRDPAFHLLSSSHCGIKLTFGDGFNQRPTRSNTILPPHRGCQHSSSEATLHSVFFFYIYISLPHTSWDLLLRQRKQAHSWSTLAFSAPAEAKDADFFFSPHFFFFPFEGINLPLLNWNRSVRDLWFAVAFVRVCCLDRRVLSYRAV